MDLVRNCGGRVSIESLLEVLVVIAVVPPLVCCALQAALTVIAIVVPWVVLGVVAIGVAACLAAGLALRNGRPRHMLPIPPGGGPVLPPIRRPPALPAPVREGRER